MSARVLDVTSHWKGIFFVTAVSTLREEMQSTVKLRAWKATDIKQM
jgi:hypothetical protein